MQFQKVVLWCKNTACELASIDARALAAFRISLASIILVDLMMRFRFFSLLYSDHGAVPRSLVPETGKWAQYISLLHGSDAYMIGVFMATTIAALCLLLGYRTRLATIAVFILLTAVQDRLLVTAFGADAQLRLMLFWAIFLPLGARYSLDQILQATPKITRYCSLAALALLSQIGMLYLLTALNKTASWYETGTAAELILQAQQFTTAFAPTFYAWFQPILKPLTIGIWYVQLLAFPLVFSPLFTKHARFITALLLIIFHLGLLITMRLDIFPLVSLTGLIIFLPDYVWDRLEKSLRFFATTDTENLSQKPAPTKYSTLKRYVASVVVGTLLFINLIHNTEVYNPQLIKLPNIITTGLVNAGLAQRWRFFEYTQSETEWVVISGTRFDGSQVDVYHNSDTVTYDLPPRGQDFANHRIYSFLSRLHYRLEEFEPIQKTYLGYLCQEWNTNHAESDKIYTIKIIHLINGHGQSRSHSYSCSSLPQTP